MYILTLAFFIVTISGSFALSKWLEYKLNPRAHLWTTIGASVLFMFLVVSLRPHLLVGVVIGCVLAYSIYQRYRAYLKSSSGA